MSELDQELKRKPGQTVQVTARQIDENGFVLSEEEAEWFGFSNEDANTFHMALVQGTYAVADQFRETKTSNQSGKPSR